MATNTIKGITVKLGGDTKDLQGQFAKLENNSKSIQRELNLVNKELKFNPDSAILLAQKQELLEEKITNSRKALQKLDEIRDEVEQKAKSGDLGAEEYRAYQREVESTKSILEHFETELQNTGDKFKEVQRKSGEVTFSNAEDKIDHLKGKFKDFADEAVSNVDKVKESSTKIGDSLESVGSTVSVGSATAAAVLAGSVTAFEDLDDGYDIIVKKTGATGEAFDSLKASADSLFSNSIFDMTDIGNAIGEVNTRFGFTDEKLKSVSETYLQFANINDTDVSDSVAKSARIMEAWNVSTENIPDLLGLISAKGQETGISVDTLMDSVISNNSTFKEMGLSLEESIGLMAQFEKNGVDSSTALAALKAAVKNSVKDGQSLSEALQQNVSDIKNAKTETEALQTATELFGAKGAAEMTNSIREGRLSFDDLSGSMTDYKDTVKKTYEGTLDPIDESKKMINNLKLAGTELADVALKEGEPLIEDVISGIKGITQWLQKLTPEEKKTLTKTIEIVAVAGPAVTIAGKAVKSIGNIVSVIPSLVSKLTAATAAQGGLNAMMDANPVGAVTLAITGFIAVLGGAVVAINAMHDAQLESAGFKTQIENTQAAVDKIKELKEEINSTVDTINTKLTDTTSEMGVINDYQTQLDELLSKATLTPEEQGKLITIGDYFKDKEPEFEETWDKYISVDEDGKVSITGNVEELKGSLDGLIDKYKKAASESALSQLAQENALAIQQSNQTLKDSGSELLAAKAEFDNFVNEWNLTEENLNTLANTTPWYSWENADKSKTLSAGDVLNQYNQLSQALQTANDDYLGVAESAAQLKVNEDDIAKQRAVLNGNYEDAEAVMLAYNNGLITANDIENSRWGSLDNLERKLESTSRTSKQAAKQSGEELGEGLGNALDTYTSQMYDKGIELARKALKGVDKEAEINSPSRAMYRRGKYLVEGFVNGLKDGSGITKIWSATKNIASTALSGIKNFLGIKSPSREAKKLGSFFGQGFIDGINDNQSAVDLASKNLAKSAKKGLETARLDAAFAQMDKMSSGKLPTFDLSSTYASLRRMSTASSASSSRKTISNITNSNNNNARVNVTINAADLSSADNTEELAEKLAGIIIREGMTWG